MNDDLVKISKQSNDCESMIYCSDENYYPYGSSLKFEDDMINELNIENLTVGDIVEVRAYGFIDSKYNRVDTNDSKKSVDLQLTSIKLNRETGDRAEQLYGPDS